MSFNLPPNRLLKVTKGNWAEVQYPTIAVVQANLRPRDFFEAVDVETPRSCVPAGAQDFRYLFDSNSGKMTIRGPTMFPAMSVTFVVNDTWDVAFVGSCMQVRETIGNEAAIDVLLTHCEHTLPALLSAATGLSIFCESIELALGEALEARAETRVPPNHIRVLDDSMRIGELQRGIEMLGLALSSARFTLASCYLREAMFLDSAYYSHNPYTLSLVVILKCAQAIEVLFSGERDAIRDKCRALGIGNDVVERDIVSIVVSRNSLGTAHASGFVPTPREVDTLRHFAQRSVHTVRQLLLYIYRAKPERREYLNGPTTRDREKEKLLNLLEENLKQPLWCVEDNIEWRQVLFQDPRL